MAKIFQKAKQSLVDFVNAAPPSVRISTGISLAIGAVALTAKGIRTYATLSPEINQILTLVDYAASVLTYATALGGNFGAALGGFLGHYSRHGLNPANEDDLRNWNCSYWCNKPLSEFNNYIGGLKNAKASM